MTELGITHRTLMATYGRRGTTCAFQLQQLGFEYQPRPHRDRSDLWLYCPHCGTAIRLSGTELFSFPWRPRQRRNAQS